MIDKEILLSSVAMNEKNETPKGRAERGSEYKFPDGVHERLLNS